MATTQNSNGSKESSIKAAADLILKLGVLLFILFLSFKIIWPFLGILIWSLVIAVILFPLTKRVSDWLGNRHKIASIFVTFTFFALLAVPSIWLVNQLIVGVGILAADISDGSLTIPYPHESVMQWPVIGDEIYKHWLDLAEDFGEAVLGFMPHISGFIEKLVGALGNTGMGILQFALSILIAVVFLMFFRQGSISGKKHFRKLAAFGGFMAFGFIGLFLGAIVRSLTYKLYLSWISYE